MEVAEKPSIAQTVAEALCAPDACDLGGEPFQTVLEAVQTYPLGAKPPFLCPERSFSVLCVHFLVQTHLECLISSNEADLFLWRPTQTFRARLSSSQVGSGSPRSSQVVPVCWGGLCSRCVTGVRAFSHASAFQQAISKPLAHEDSLWHGAANFAWLPTFAQWHG